MDSELPDPEAPRASAVHSRVVLGLALLLAAGLGGTLGYVTRTPDPILAPQELQIRAKRTVPATDLLAALTPRLERLIAAQGNPSDSPEGTAVIRSIALAAGRDPATASWLEEQLAAPQVPEVLLTELLGELRSSPAGSSLVRQLVLGRLRDSSPARQEQGVRLVRALGLGRTAVSGRCACEAGVFPADPAKQGSNEPRYAVAWALDEGSTIRWSPARDGSEHSGWGLNLETSDSETGAATLLFRLTEVALQGTLTLEAEGGPRIRL